MKLKVFCHFDSNSFQNAQNLLFQALEKANFERFESYSNQSDKRLLSFIKNVELLSRSFALGKLKIMRL